MSFHPILSLTRIWAQTQACDGGDVRACYSLGLAYRNGSGAPKNPGRGVEFLQRACDRRHAEGCFILAQMYTSGFGVPMDVARGKAFYEQACAQGDARSCYLGSVQANGSTPGDPSIKAESFRAGGEVLRRQCEAGYAGSCFEVGAMYLNGSTQYGVVKDVAQALALFQKACAGGFAQACVAASRLKP